MIDPSSCTFSVDLVVQAAPLGLEFIAADVELVASRTGTATFAWPVRMEVGAGLPFSRTGTLVRVASTRLSTCLGSLVVHIQCHDDRSVGILRKRAGRIAANCNFRDPSFGI